MTPFKVKNAYTQMASAMSLPPEDIKLINQFYWKYVRSKLSNLVNPIVLLSGLGTMELKHWKIDSTIDRLQKKVIKWSDTSNGSSIYDSYKSDLEKVTAIRDMLNNQTEKLLDVKQRKKEYENKCVKTLEN